MEEVNISRAIHYKPSALQQYSGMKIHLSLDDKNQKTTGIQK